MKNTTFERNVSVSAAEGASDGDVYVLDGDLVVTQSMSVSGSVYVPYGGGSIDNNAVIVGDPGCATTSTCGTRHRRGRRAVHDRDVYGDRHIFGDVVAAGRSTPATSTSRA